MLVTHDAALAARCDRVVRLRSGRIEADAVREVRAHERRLGTSRASRRPLTLRFALREMRGGLRGFAVFIACIALGVAAIAGVGSFARSLADGLAREGRVILGGDVSFSLSQREASDGGARVPRRPAAGSRSPPPCGRWRARGGESALVEIKAVDGAYPLFGTRRARTRGRLAAALALRDGVLRRRRRSRAARAARSRDAARASRSAARRSSCAPCCETEPDKLAGGIGFGPRLLISEAALRATGLLQPGSLVRWHYRLRIPGADANDRAAQAVVAAAETQLPDAGWEVRTRANASPRSAATSSASRSTSRWSA